MLETLLILTYIKFGASVLGSGVGVSDASAQAGHQDHSSSCPCQMFLGMFLSSLLGASNGLWFTGFEFQFPFVYECCLQFLIK